MKTKNKEFDRTFLKTHKSRSAKFTLLKKSGFTLIELLVVISIISLLSSIILAVVQDARVKARNSAKNSLALEYVKALELYKSDHNGTYPISGNTLAPVCFGYTSSETCFGDSSSGSDTIKTNMQPYFGKDFADRNSIPTNTVDFKGFTYLCTGTTNCDSYVLEWILEKGNTDCIEHSTQIPNFNSTEHTYCSYTLN